MPACGRDSMRNTASATTLRACAGMVITWRRLHINSWRVRLAARCTEARTSAVTWRTLSGS